jgi:hypothetical protein
MSDVQTAATGPGNPNQRRFAPEGSAAAVWARVANEWRNVIIDYEAQALATAQAEFNYKDTKRRHIRAAQLKEPKLTTAKATDFAEVDEEIATLNLEYMLEAARLDAMQKKLRYLEAEHKRFQSMNTNERQERELDRQHQPG